MDSASIARLREEYSEGGLDESQAGNDPVALFHTWLYAAVESGMHEPNAMALATATPDGRPSVRVVLLKALDETGAVFYTNYGSRKGDELIANPRAALAMMWHPLQRQVRIEGSVERVRQDESDAYFAGRPRGSQLGALASPQSQVVPDRDVLEQRYEYAQATYPSAVPRPSSWGGFRVTLEVVEFWQGRPSRLHDRIRFTRAGGDWVRERLAP